VNPAIAIGVKPEIEAVQRLPQVSAFETYLEHARELLLLYGTRIVIALISLAIGWRIIRLLLGAFRKVLQIRDVDPTLRPFLSSLISIVLKVLLLMTVASMAGIETTSFVAALGAAGLAIGLALQGSLSNFAGGVLILLFKPFRVGDLINAQGGEGTVSEINILYTTLTTPDNKKVVIPNGVLSNNMITNYTAADTRRLDMVFPLSFNSDPSAACALVKKVIEKDRRIIREPAPVVAIDTVTETGLKLICNVWVQRRELADIKFSLNEAIVSAFQEGGISSPVNSISEQIASGLTNGQKQK
jgi:small conductance mechanosensitive channel